MREVTAPSQHVVRMGDAALAAASSSIAALRTAAPLAVARAIGVHLLLRKHVRFGLDADLSAC